MSGRLPAGLVVSALLRLVNDSGGMGAVLAKGDAQAGGVLIIVADREGDARVLERGLGPSGDSAIVESHRSDNPSDYWRRRRARDPDLWVVELDTPQAERFIAETLLTR